MPDNNAESWMLAAGIQTHVMSIPGPVVALAAHEHLLAVVWHAGPPFASGSQCLHFSLLDAADQSQVMYLTSNC